MKYIWERINWTDFQWDTTEINSLLTSATKEQGYILGVGESFTLSDTIDFITSEVINTSRIEGELLDLGSVRSSVAQRLGLKDAGLKQNNRIAEGLIEALLDGVTNYNTTLTDERLFSWHAGLFPTGYSGINKITVANWRTGSEPMEVVSGKMGTPKVHFTAPASGVIADEMRKFLKWFNNCESGLINAAIAHLWFVTIHPFDDGNGRIARIITDMALAKDEKTGKRLYSLSTQIMNEKEEYYRILEETQKGSGDITNWIKWFLRTFIHSIEYSKSEIKKSMMTKELFTSLKKYRLNNRQEKVVKKMIESYPGELSTELTNKRYVKITKVSPETAKRDIKRLIELGIIDKTDAGGRSTSYKLSKDYSA